MNYKQLIDSLRYQIESYFKAGYSHTKIAKTIGVHKSTIGRELKRNSKKRTYNASFAITISKERKSEAYKHTVLNTSMKRYIEDKMINHQWSPEQIKVRCDLQT